MNQKPEAKPRARASLLRGAAVAAAFLLVACAWAANRSAHQADTQAARSGAAEPSPRTAASKAQPTPAPAGWQYDIVLTRNLFKSPAASASAEQPGELAPMPVGDFHLFDVEPEQAQQPEKAEDRFPWVYAGYATADGTPIAILENSQTRQASFLTVGEQLEGLVAREITPSSLRLERDGEPVSLTISDAFTATPLDEPRAAAPASEGDRRSGRRGASGANNGDGDSFRGGIPPWMGRGPELSDEGRRGMGDFMRRGRFRRDRAFRESGGPPGHPSPPPEAVDAINPDDGSAQGEPQ